MPIDGLGVVSRAAGEPALVEDIVIDDPGPGEVLVRIQASGVCHTTCTTSWATSPTSFPSCSVTRARASSRPSARA